MRRGDKKEPVENSQGVNVQDSQLGEYVDKGNPYVENPREVNPQVGVKGDDYPLKEDSFEPGVKKPEPDTSQENPQDPNNRVHKILGEKVRDADSKYGVTSEWQIEGLNADKSYLFQGNFEECEKYVNDNQPK